MCPLLLLQAAVDLTLPRATDEGEEENMSEMEGGVNSTAEIKRNGGGPEESQDKEARTEEKEQLKCS